MFKYVSENVNRDKVAVATGMTPVSPDEPINQVTKFENLNPDIKTLETVSGWFFETKTKTGEKVTGYVRK